MAARLARTATRQALARSITSGPAGYGPRAGPAGLEVRQELSVRPAAG